MEPRIIEGRVFFTSEPAKDKCVKEVQIKYFKSFPDAQLGENYLLKTIEVENNTFPNSLSIEIDGILKDFRLKSFQRQNDQGNFIENVYILIS